MTTVLVRTVLTTGPPAGRLCIRVHDRVVSATSTVVPVFGADELEPVTDEHVRAEADEMDPILLGVADVTVRSGGCDGVRPGCLVVAMSQPGGDGTTVTCDGWRLDAPMAGAAGEFASFVHTWVVTGEAISRLQGAAISIAGGPCVTVSVHRTRRRPADL